MIGPEILVGPGVEIQRGTFPLPLRTELLDDSETDKLTAPFVYVTGGADWLEVPAGFETDYTSVPRVFRLLPFIGVWFNKRGKYSKAAVIHDWLCELARDRKGEQFADHMFLECMDVLGVDRIRKRLMYRAVSLWDSYKGNA